MTSDQQHLPKTVTLSGKGIVETMLPVLEKMERQFRGMHMATHEHITAAAIQIEGVTLSLPRPARHAEVLNSANAMGVPESLIHTAVQGFLTSAGRFVNRVQAKQIAHIAGQPIIRDDPHPRDAFSEDFW